jgi:hypothetical protein
MKFHFLILYRIFLFNSLLVKFLIPAVSVMHPVYHHKIIPQLSMINTMARQVIRLRCNTLQLVGVKRKSRQRGCRDERQGEPRRSSSERKRVNPPKIGGGLIPLYHFTLEWLRRNSALIPRSLGSCSSQLESRNFYPASPVNRDLRQATKNLYPEIP